MWTRLIVATLLIASLSGCLGLQTGERVGELEATSQDPVETNATSGSAGDGQAASQDDGQADGNGTQADQGGQDQQDQADGNETDGQATSQDAGQADQDDDQAPAPPSPDPWNLTGNASLGYVAGAGAEFVGPSEAPEDQGQTDASYCPTATFALPATASTVLLTVQGDPADADEPGLGAYSVNVTHPNGTWTYMAFSDTLGPDGASQMSAEIPSPGAGTWTVEVDPNGPVAQQRWQLTVQAQGEAFTPPPGLALATTC